MSSYVEQSKEEILAEYLSCPLDEFMLVLRHDVLHAFSVAKNASDILDEMFDEAEFNKEAARNLTHIIHRHSDYVVTLFEAALEYDKIQRNKNANTAE